MQRAFLIRYAALAGAVIALCAVSLGPSPILAVLAASLALGGTLAVTLLRVATREMAAGVHTMVSGRKELLNGVSHELRTPLARLEFALELIAMTDSDEERLRHLDEARADVTELTELVRELLQYGALEETRTATVQTAPTPAQAMLEQLVADARRLRPEVVVQLAAAGPLGAPPLDARLTQRALGNLLSNAVRYATSQVVVRAERRGGRLEICVEDDGPGVPASDRARIFDPFVRLDAARSRDTGGTGLGLPIAAGAARAHGGSIDVGESALGGALFRFIVPAPGE